MNNGKAPRSMRSNADAIIAGILSGLGTGESSTAKMMFSANEPLVVKKAITPSEGVNDLNISKRRAPRLSSGGSQRNSKRLV